MAHLKAPLVFQLLMFTKAAAFQSISPLKTKYLPSGEKRAHKTSFVNGS
jgi:hypothetical protein